MVLIGWVVVSSLFLNEATYILSASFQNKLVLCKNTSKNVYLADDSNISY